MASKTGVVTANTLNLRKEPSTDSPIQKTLTRGAKVEILKAEGAWYQVKAGGTTGFVHGDFIRIVETDHAAGFLHEREDLASVPLGRLPQERSGRRMAGLRFRSQLGRDQRNALDQHGRAADHGLQPPPDR